MTYLKTSPKVFYRNWLTRLWFCWGFAEGGVVFGVVVFIFGVVVVESELFKKVKGFLNVESKLSNLFYPGYCEIRNEIVKIKSFIIDLFE